MKANETPQSIYKTLVRSDDAKYIAWLLAALTPWTAIPPAQPLKPGGKAPQPWGAVVAREGLKAESKICSMIAGAFKQYGEIISLKDAIKRGDVYINERDTIGMMIRKWESQGGHWKLQVLFALLVEAMKLDSANGMAIYPSSIAWYIANIFQAIKPYTPTGRLSSIISPT